MHLSLQPVRASSAKQTRRRATIEPLESRTLLTGTFSDPLTAPLSSAVWKTIQTTAGQFSSSASSAGLHQTKTSKASVGGLQSIEEQLNLAALKGTYSGNFSTSVSWTGAVLGPNLDQVELHTVFNDGHIFFDSLSFENGHLNYHVWNGSSEEGTVSTSATSGMFTISRAGSTITTSFNGKAFFSTSETGTLTDLNFTLQNNESSNDNTSVTFKNFSLAAAGVTPPVQNGTITGMVFLDTNGDGKQDNGEKPAMGWVVYIDANKNGQFDPGETAVLTPASGAFVFSLKPGTYTIGLEPRWGHTLTTPSKLELTVTVVAGKTVSAGVFGVK